MQHKSFNSESSDISSNEIKKDNKRVALFPGTFDPFTIGHESLVRRGLTLMDEIVIAIGVNESKKYFFPLEKRIQMIRDFYAHNPRIRVESYNTLTVDFAHEKSIADMNRTISKIETFVLFTEPSLTHISSTLVRELMQYGRDVSEFIPNGYKI